MTIRFTVDSRDKIFQNKFGAVIDLPEEFNVDSSLYDDVQPVGDVKCVAYTACDIAEDQTKTVYDIDDLWQRVPKYPSGSDPRDVFNEAIANGLLPKGKTEREKRWSSYWRADLGSHDPFDNLRSAMVTVNSPVGIGTYWYMEWVNKTNLPLGKTASFGHMYVCEGWKLIDGKPHLIIEAWTGRKLYMSREVFNAALKPYGMQTWVLSTAEIDTKRSKSLIEMIKDVMVNLIITLRTKIRTFNVEPVVSETPVDTVSVKETSVAKFEWKTKEQAKHSVRVICDEEGLSLSDKNILCAVISCESGFNTQAINKNSDARKSTDYGICQYNDYWYIGKGKPIASIEEALNNPEKCVRVMIQQMKAGRLKDWVCYSSGKFAKHL